MLHRGDEIEERPQEVTFQIPIHLALHQGFHPMELLFWNPYCRILFSSSNITNFHEIGTFKSK